MRTDVTDRIASAERRAARQHLAAGYHDGDTPELGDTRQFAGTDDQSCRYHRQAESALSDDAGLATGATR